MRQAPFFWITVALISGCIGYFSLRTTPEPSRISFTGRPETQADKSLDVDIWNESFPYIVARDRVVLISEGRAEDGPLTRFFSPRSAEQDGSVLLRFPLEPDKTIQKAFLTLKLASFYTQDETANVQIELRSERTNGYFLKLAELNSKTQENVIPESVDISEYVRGSTAVEIKITVRASKLLYHPTPNDPIGYAGAQALRQLQLENWCARLELWYEK
jgi:hypothetical protein